MSGASSSGRVRKNAARLGDVRAQRAAALALEQREVLGRERAEQRRLVGLVVQLRHAVVLQVVADGQVLAHLDPERLEVLRRPDAGEHQQHRRLVGAGREDHLALGAQLLDLAAARDLDADGARRRRTGSAARARPVMHVEVRPRARRMQEGGSRRPAAAVALRQLEAADALLARAVEVVGCARGRRCTARLDHRLDRSGSSSGCRDTLSGPPAPWNASSPRSLSSERLKYGSTSS